MEQLSGQRRRISMLYGQFSEEQFDKWITSLHKKIFQLLLYKDPKTCDKYKNVNFDKYYESLVDNLNAMNELLSHSEVIVEVITNLEAAFLETKQEDFLYVKYRKYILDAQSLVDKIKGELL